MNTAVFSTSPFPPRGTRGGGKHALGNLSASGYARYARRRRQFLAGDQPDAIAYRAARAHAWAEILRGRRLADADRETRNARRLARRLGGAA